MVFFSEKMFSDLRKSILVLMVLLLSFLTNRISSGHVWIQRVASVELCKNSIESTRESRKKTMIGRTEIIESLRPVVTHIAGWE